VCQQGVQPMWVDIGTTERFRPLGRFRRGRNRCSLSHTCHTPAVVFHAKKDRATNANAHLAHLQALTHKPMLQLAKEPNFCQHTD